MRCVQNEKKEILNKSQKLFLDQSVSVAVVMMMMPSNAFYQRVWRDFLSYLEKGIFYN